MIRKDNLNRSVRIGGFSAFWGDTSNGAYQLLTQGGHIDYMIGDYLSEVTMGILGRGKTKVQDYSPYIIVWISKCKLTIFRLLGVWVKEDILRSLSRMFGNHL